jgi:REase_AHJR-like
MSAPTETSTTTMDSEKFTLEKLRTDFEAKGYRFEIEPTRDLLPSFLQNYQPDAVAIGKGENDKVIIEVRRPNTRAKVKLAELSQEMAEKNGWRYLLVYIGQDPSEIVELSRPEKFQVDEAIKEIRDLERAGFLKAAMLEGWAVLEALARRIYKSDIRVSLKPLSPVSVIERLAMEGLLSDTDAKRLRALSSIRNSVVHGDLNVSVSEDDLSYLLKSIEKINGHVTV